MLDKLKCIVLNASYEPLDVVPAKRGLVLFLKGKAKILEEHPDVFITSGGMIWGLPLQVVLFEQKKARPRRPAVLNKQNLFRRDKYTCQYCGRHKSKFKETEKLTKDHIVPQDLGGRDTWLNLVTACSTCNNKKANIPLGRSGLKLLSNPRVPTSSELWSDTINKLRSSVVVKDS